MKAFRDSRVLFIAVLAICLIIETVFFNKEQVKDDQGQQMISVCLNEDTRDFFEEQYETKKSFKKKFAYKEDREKADFIFSSNIEDIDRSRDFSIIGYSPIVVGLKNTKKLNRYLKDQQQGFLTCSDGKIKNKITDKVKIDFKKIISVVLDGGDWTDLGGDSHQKIKIYYPNSPTEKELFYVFLLITINDGIYPDSSNIEEIKEIADRFMESKNVFATDVATKMQKMGNSLEESDIYVLFESSLLEKASNDLDICIAYPEVTVEKQLYLQYVNVQIEDLLSRELNKSDKLLMQYYSLEHEIYYSSYRMLSNYYRNYLYRQDYFNTQNGVNSYDLINIS